MSDVSALTPRAGSETEAEGRGVCQRRRHLGWKKRVVHSDEYGGWDVLCLTTTPELACPCKAAGVRGSFPRPLLVFFFCARSYGKGLDVRVYKQSYVTLAHGADP